MKILRLILGDQLNLNHSWFKNTDDEILYVLMEVKQETNYVLHHAQKILAIFAAMRDFKSMLAKKNHQVIYFKINEKSNQQSFKLNLNTLLTQHNIQKFEYLEPDEYRLDHDLTEFCTEISIPSECFSSEHFYTNRSEVNEIFTDKKQWLMESFYRYMRKRHNVLMSEDGKPVGSKWNFDHENRKAWKGEPKVFEDHRPTHDHSELWNEITEAKIKSFGNHNASKFRWPLNRKEALKHLDHMPAFGDQNYFSHQLPVPNWFWNGKTKMNCLKYTINQSLDEAYAHHIQRLMIVGNFSLLAGINPKSLHEWYLGIYIDAFEWVEMPNTLGMSQFADGGKLASKPYVSTANYINKMSNYCEGCHYSKSDRLGDKACPFNSLYWNFFISKAGQLSKNPRLAIVHKQIRDMDANLIKDIQLQAKKIIKNIEDI